MQITRWYRLLVIGMLALPIANRAQDPQPKIKEIATIPGMDLPAFDGEAVRMPNGRIVVFAVADSITAYDLATKRRTPITRGWSYDLAVSQQGDRLAYTRTAEDGKTNLMWSVPIDARTGAPTGPAQRVSTSSGSTPRFSPDGKSIAFASGRGGLSNLKRELVVVPAVGGAERVVAQYNTLFSPRWSADGRSIFVDLWNPFGKERWVERVSATGGDSQLLPVFSRQDGGENSGGIDGQLAFYRSSAGWYEGRIAYKTASGAQGEFRIPPQAIGVFNAARTLAIRTTTTNAMRVLTLDDGKVRPVAAEGLFARGAMWSPDGKRLAFVVTDGERPELVVMNADGSGQRRVPFSGLTESRFWSPDGGSLLYAADSGREIRVLNVASGQSRVLVSVTAPSSITGAAVWQPDGKSFLAAVLTGSKSSIVEFRLDGTKKVVRDLSAEFPAAINAYPISTRQAVVELGESRALGPKQAFLVPLAGGAARSIPMPALEPRRRLVSGFAYAANGKWLVANILSGFRVVGLQAMSTGTDSTRVLRFPADFGPFHPLLLLPDGEHVLKVGSFGATTTDFTKIVYSIPLDGTAWRVLGRIPPPNFGNSGVGNAGMPGALSSDGKRFAFLEIGKPTTHFYDVDLTPVLKAINKH